MPLKYSVNAFTWNARMFAFIGLSFRKSLIIMSDSNKKKTSLLPVSIREVEDKMAVIRGMEVIADADVAPFMEWKLSALTKQFAIIPRSFLLVICSN